MATVYSDYTMGHCSQSSQLHLTHTQTQTQTHTHALLIGSFGLAQQLNGSN